LLPYLWEVVGKLTEKEPARNDVKPAEGSNGVVPPHSRALVVPIKNSKAPPEPSVLSE